MNCKMVIWYSHFMMPLCWADKIYLLCYSYVILFYFQLLWGLMGLPDVINLLNHGPKRQKTKVNIWSLSTCRCHCNTEHLLLKWNHNCFFPINRIDYSRSHDHVGLTTYAFGESLGGIWDNLKIPLQYQHFMAGTVRSVWEEKDWISTPPSILNQPANHVISNGLKCLLNE